MNYLNMKFPMVHCKQGRAAIVLEFKTGRSCEEAIKQKNYMQRVEYCKEVLLVGINYSEEKHHECKIEKWK